MVGGCEGVSGCESDSGGWGGSCESDSGGWGGSCENDSGGWGGTSESDSGGWGGSEDTCESGFGGWGNNAETGQCTDTASAYGDQCTDSASAYGGQCTDSANAYGGQCTETSDIFGGIQSNCNIADVYGCLSQQETTVEDENTETVDTPSQAPEMACMPSHSQAPEMQCIASHPSSIQAPATSTGIGDIFAGVELDVVGIIGFEAGFGLVLDTDDLMNSGIYGTIGPAVGANVGIGVGAGIVEEINEWSYGLDANIGAVSPTFIGDKNGFNGMGLSGGIGAGLSASATYTETYSISEMVDDFTEAVDGVRDFFSDGD